ncbi:MAG: release factor glutamine methyltransferase [bacterium]|jgi:release factor glutamine methyltransferase
MSSQEIWTPIKLVQWAESYFKKNKLPHPHRYEAELLISHALQITRMEIYLEYDRPCTPSELQTVRGLIQRRIAREPVAYILGTWEFWSLTLEIDQGVLIPRKDTEVLIESALKIIPENRDSQFHILELGTGSGAIPLAIAQERKNLSIVTVEKNTIPLNCARKNIQKYESEIQKQNNQISLVQGNLFNSIHSIEFFDLIISNPPYIPSHDIPTLQSEVTEWEPAEALDGGDDGLVFYRYLEKAGTFILKPQGHLLVEHGIHQEEEIQEIFLAQENYQFTEKNKDLSQISRTLTFQKC